MKWTLAAVGAVMGVAFALTRMALQSTGSSTDALALIWIPVYAAIGVAIVLIIAVAIGAVRAARDLRRDTRRI
jgi:ABC-type antimicrobial peptide transport system permease subunit